MAEWKGRPNYVVVPKKSMDRLPSGQYFLGFVTPDPRSMYHAFTLNEAVEFAKNHTLDIALCRNKEERDELRIALGDAPKHS